jgi:hypothetical protein
MEVSDKGLSAGVTTNFMRLTDAAIRAATLPSGKSHHYLHDTEQPGLAIRMRATGGRTWVYLFTKPGASGTHRSFPSNTFTAIMSDDHQIPPFDLRRIRRDRRRARQGGPQGV